MGHIRAGEGLHVLLYNSGLKRKPSEEVKNNVYCDK